MSRYIDADALAKDTWMLYRAEEHIDYNVAIVDALNVIDEQPTADVIPIEWIKEQKNKCFPYSTAALVLNGLLTEWERRTDGEIH